MATHSSILAWKIPWTEEPGGYSPWGHKELDRTEWLTLSLSLHIQNKYKLNKWEIRECKWIILISIDQYRQHIKKQRHYFAKKGLSSQGYSFSSGRVWMWGLEYKESWAPKNWCFWTVVLKKTLESSLDCKEIQSGNPKGDQSWVFTGRTDVEAETPILWPPDVKSWLIWKDPDAGKDWGQEEKGTTEDEIVGWHHWLNGRGFG